MDHNYCLLSEFRQLFLFSMFGTAFVPAGNFAFNHARVDSVAARRNLLSADHPDHRRVRRKISAKLSADTIDSRWAILESTRRQVFR